jgi:hypothetical protein
MDGDLNLSDEFAAGISADSIAYAMREVGGHHSRGMCAAGGIYLARRARASGIGDRIVGSITISRSELGRQP